MQKQINDQDLNKSITTEMYWWLNSKRPFFIGDEYEISLEKIDTNNKSVKIRIRNLKNSAIPEEMTLNVEDESAHK